MLPLDRKESLPKKLQEIVDTGFTVVEGAVFFKALHKDPKLPDQEFIKSAYGDLSGYESASNKIHIDDFCEHNILLNSIIFASEFSKKWRNSFSTPSVLVVSYDDDSDIGPSGTFQFHLKRSGETVFDHDRIESFMDPMIIIITEPSKWGLLEDLNRILG